MSKKSKVVVWANGDGEPELRRFQWRGKWLEPDAYGLRAELVKCPRYGSEVMLVVNADSYWIALAPTEDGKPPVALFTIGDASFMHLAVKEVQTAILALQPVQPRPIRETVEAQS